MADRNELAFLKNALSVTGTDPQEQTALENLLFTRLLTAGLTLNNSGVFGFSSVTDGQILIGKTSDHSLNLATLTAGSNVTITNGAGAVTIAVPSAGGTVTHTSGALTASALVVGNGAADIDVLASLGTTTTVLHGNAAGRPTFGAVTLTTDVAGTLPVTNGGTGVATATAHGVMLGNGTSAQTVTAAGAIGTVLTGMGASADPTFQSLSNATCQGRLTLTSGTPVTTADVTGATTIYFTPYGGNGIALYDGSAGWKTITFAETSLALGTLTSGLPYDVFGFLNGSTLNTELLAWTSSTARATALVLQDGVLSKSGALTRRYLGTFYTSSTTATEDSYAKRYVWNYYNRVRRVGRVFESTDNWTYSTATWRQSNGATANQLDFVIGVAEVNLHAQCLSVSANGSPGTRMQTAIGEDSTSVPSTTHLYGQAEESVANIKLQNWATLDTYPAIGRHFYAWLEFSAAIPTTTWYGDNGANSSIQTGIEGWTEG